MRKNFIQLKAIQRSVCQAIQVAYEKGNLMSIDLQCRHLKEDFSIEVIQTTIPTQQIILSKREENAYKESEI